MAITPAMIKELRELTGSGMTDCKKALEACEGDVKKAVEFLREKGLAAAAKKAGRIAAEGVCTTVVKSDFSKAIVTEVNCETDFVAMNPDFKEYCMQVSKQALDSAAAGIEDFLNEKWSLDASVTVKEALSQQIAKIGENLNIRRFERFTKTTPGIIASYVHGGGKIGVILDIECAVNDDRLAEMGKNVCMQIAALFPKYIRREDIAADFIESEKRIITEQIKNEPANAKKPANILEKMAEGMLTKNLKELCVLEQAYVRDGSMTVNQYVESVAKEIGSPIRLARFVCYEKGEGIEKKVEDFAAEVAKAMQ